MPTSACARAGLSLMPSPTIATTFRRPCRSCTATSHRVSFAEYLFETLEGGTLSLFGGQAGQPPTSHCCLNARLFTALR